MVISINCFWNRNDYVYDDMSLTLYGKKHHYTIGDRVDVIVASANTHLRQIDFELVGVEKALKNYVVKKKEVNEKPQKNKKSSKKSSKNTKNYNKKSTKRKRR